jgi:O-antigen ligase
VSVAARPSLIAIALALFLVASQFYTDLSALFSQDGPFVVLVPKWGAALLFATLAASGGYCAWRSANARDATERTPVPLVLLCAVGAFCALLGFDPARSLGAVALLALACGMHAATVRFYRVRGVATALFGSMLVVGCIASLAALVMEWTRTPLQLAVVNNDRAAGYFTTPNQFAAFLVTFVALGAAAGFGAERPWLRTLGWVAVGVGVVSMVATYSRGGWIGLGVAIVAFLLFVRRPRTALATALALVAVSVVIFGGDRHHESADSYSRIPALQAGLTTFALFPLAGVGPAAYDHVHPAVRPADAQDEDSFASLHPHNVVLSLLAEEGVLGFAAVAFAVRRFGIALHARLAGVPRPQRLAALALAAGLVGTLGQGMVDLVAVAELTFVWIPFSAIALAVAAHGVPE